MTAAIWNLEMRDIKLNLQAYLAYLKMDCGPAWKLKELWEIIK